MSEQKKILLNEIRAKFLGFLAGRNHVIIPSAPLVPENDATTLFTSSGMQPLVPYLAGQIHPEGERLADSQKCFRANDIEEVGDARHTTFFEMLGNWSLGDYFKEGQISQIWTFLTCEVGLDPQRIFVTVFAGNKELAIERDDEAIGIWQKLFVKANLSSGVEYTPEVNGLVADKRIFCYPAGKNWWSRSGVPANMPAGELGGPDTEIFYDFDANSVNRIHENSQWADDICHVNCDCGRFVEIGNSVFMQFIKAENGSFDELAKKNVDYGGGLERLVMAAENKIDIFETSTFSHLIASIEDICDLKYSDVPLAQKEAFRLIADHLRAAVMLIADGIVPSNKEQGYVLRRLIRRAIRWSRRLNVGDGDGLKIGFLADLAPIFIEMYANYYSEVKNNAQKIIDEIRAEEVRFGLTIEKGLKEIDKLEKIDGLAAFKLYESFGFPWELTAEIAAERGETLGKSDFDQAMILHKSKSKADGGKFKGGLADTDQQTVQFHTATHLLHQALRKEFGESVEQKGSNITGDRARFDFSFDRALTGEEIAKIEQQINDWIEAGLTVKREEMSKVEAVEIGALHFFLDKYPDEVSVYTVQDEAGAVISREICVGPHVANTSEIGMIKIEKEKASSRGVRRIYLARM